MTGYYNTPRPIVLRLLDQPAPRLLEIGCGTGATIRLLRERALCQWVAAVEMNETAAQAARAVVDQLAKGDLERIELDIPESSLDAILCLDVIEHLVDLWRTMRRLAALLKPDGILVASIPNIRWYKVSLPLVLMGRWRYADDGILDRTHLRFFTRETIKALFDHAE